MVRGSLDQWDIMEYKFRMGIKILKFDLFLIKRKALPLHKIGTQVLNFRIANGPVLLFFEGCRSSSLETNKGQ